MIHVSGKKLNALMHLGEFRASHLVAGVNRGSSMVSQEKCFGDPYIGE